jgi:cyclopropane fatty-acyl-phospholipid synthase-like methyltransferase
MPGVHSIITSVLADGAHLLEIGCGTGAIARVLAARPGVGDVLGVDPSPVLLTRAQEIANLFVARRDAAAPPASA